MKVQGNKPVVTTPQVADAKPAVATQGPVAAQGGWAAKAPVAAPVASSTAAAETRTRAAVENFFKAFGSHDLKGLEAAYAPNVKFTDDMFKLTKRESVMKMWGGSPPFETFKSEILEVKGNEVKARWTVDYEMFGNKIHNVIESKLTLDDQGRITSQTEDWDEKKWMKQALPFIPSFAQGLAYAVMRPLLTWQMGG